MVSMNRSLLLASAGAILMLPLFSSPAYANPIPQLEPGKAKTLSVYELPPELRKMAESDVRRAVIGKGTIFGEMSDEEAFARKNYQSRAKDIVELKGRVKSPLADISSGELAKYQFEGVIPEGPTIEGPWSSFERIFKRPDGVLVTLSEWDYVADGGGVVTVKELMNSSVNRQPAQFSVRRAQSGEVVSELKWVTKRKTFTLSVSDNVEGRKSYNMKWLVGIAESIK